MLTAFMDDSGSEGRGPVFVIAGYLAPVPVWKAFSTTWKAALAEPAELPYFKMREAHRLHDTFNGWTPDQRDRRVDQLSGVITTQPIITALIFALVWDDFRRARDEHAEVTECYPYDMLFHGVMAVTTKWLVKRNIPETIEYVFDEQGLAGERAILTYKKIKSVLPPAETARVVGSPRLADDKIVVPLQAADLLAWQIRRYWSDRGSLPIPYETNKQVSIPPLPNHPALEGLLRNETIWKLYDYETISGVFDAWTKPFPPL